MGAEDKYLKFCSKPDWSCKKFMTAGWVQSIHTMRRDERDLEVKEEKRVEMAIQMGIENDMKAIPESASHEHRPTTDGVGGGYQVNVASLVVNADGADQKSSVPSISPNR